MPRRHTLELLLIPNGMRPSDHGRRKRASRYPKDINQIADDRANCDRDQRGIASLREVKNQGESGKRNERHEHGGNIDYRRPLLSRVASLVQVVEQRYESAARFCQLILPSIAVDHGAGFVCRPFKGNLTLRIINAEIAGVVAHASPDALDPSQIFDDLGFRYTIRIRSSQPRAVERALTLDRPRLTIKPLGVIQREACRCKKEKDQEAEHGKIGVQPSRDPRELPIPRRFAAVRVRTLVRTMARAARFGDVSNG